MTFVSDVVSDACAEAGVSVADAVSKKRTADIAIKRHHVIAILHARGWSLGRIGTALGGRDHTTILHGLRRHAEINRGTQ